MVDPFSLRSCEWCKVDFVPAEANARFCCADCKGHAKRKFLAKRQRRYRNAGWPAKLVRTVTAKNVVLDFKKNNPCSICGESDYACLDFHHRDPDTKDFAMSHIHKRAGVDKIKAEIAKCIVLCANCHRKIHRDIRDNRIVSNEL